MKQLRAANLLAGAANFQVPSGQFAGFFLRATGTNVGGATTVIGNLGQVTMNTRYGATMSVPFAQLNLLDNHIGGVTENNSAIGAAFNFLCWIPASYVGDGNVFDVIDSDQMYISVDLSGVTAANVASGTISLLGVPQLGAQAYLPYIFTLTANVPASGSMPYDLNRDDVAMVFLQTLTNLDRFELVRDNFIEVQCTVAEGLACTNFFDRVETAVTTDILLNMVRSGQFNESLADHAQIKIYATGGGVCATVITAIGYFATPDIYARSKEAYNSQVTQKHVDKAAAGKMNAVTVAKSIATGA
jgi:hypothetical protein